MKTVLALFLLASAAAVFADETSTYATENGKIIDKLAGNRVPWYTDCASQGQGNYPHPYLCDHYIACEADNTTAWEMPCAMGHGQRQWYDPDSGPVESESRCVNPNTVTCAAFNATTPEPTTAPESTTEAHVETDPPAPETTTEKHVETDPPAPETTTEAPIHDCPRNGSRNVGDECEIDCDQCSWCELEDGKPVSYYWRCQRNSKPDSPYVEWKGTWRLERCGDGTLVDSKLALADDLDGGLCTAWDDLHDDTKDDYNNPDMYPECQREEPCEYGQDEECSGSYWYRAAGSNKNEPRECEGDLKWSQEHENCKPCAEVASCEGKCGTKV